MFLAALIALTTLLPRLDDGFRAARGDVAGWAHGIAVAGAEQPAMPRFLPEARAVSNWRDEAGGALRPSSLAFVVRYSATEPNFVARCVKLNNYWCIKKARWSGEIGADAEGHTGFATAADGADAAAQLLRRYYREFGRRTALGIVRRWAPAECRLPASAPVASAKASPKLATHGLGGTVRARYLARHTRAGMPRRALAARGQGLRIQPWSPLARLAGRANPMRPPAAAKSALLVPASEILVKPSTVIAKPSTLLVEPASVLAGGDRKSDLHKSGSRRPEPRKPVATAAGLPARGKSQAVPGRRPERPGSDTTTLSAAAAILASMPLLDLSVPAPVCSGDEVRIRNYASRIAASVGLKVDDDLKLFGSDGRPSPNLRAVMLAMSNVELGTLRAGPALVEAAIARLDAGTLAAFGTAAPIP